MVKPLDGASPCLRRGDFVVAFRRGIIEETMDRTIQMPARFSDQQIASFLKEQKAVPDNFRARIQPKAKHGHKEEELDFEGAEGNRFKLILRQSLFNHLIFL